MSTGSKNALCHDSEQPGVFPSENCDHEPGAPCHRRREWNGRWISPSLRAREPCRRRCDRHWAQEARHLPPQAERSSRWRLRRLPRSAFHHGRELCASTKAEYICADQPVTSFFACNKAADHTFRLARESARIRTCWTRSMLASRSGSGLRFSAMAAAGSLLSLVLGLVGSSSCTCRKPHEKVCSPTD